MKYLGPIGLAVAAVGVVGLVVKFFVEGGREREILRNQWHTVKSGRFDHARFDVKHVDKAENEYGFGKHRHEYRVRYRTAKKDITVIVFEDGSNCIFDGQVETPFAKGSEILVRENGLGHRCLRAA